MPIRPNINLMGQQADLTTVFPLFQEARAASQRNAMFPIAQQQAQTQANREAFLAQQERQNALTESVVRGAEMVKPYIDAQNFDGAMQALQQRRANLQAQGIETSNTDQAIELLQSNPEQFKASVDTLVNFGQQSGILGQGVSAAQREYQSLTQGLTEREQDKARRIKLGLEPRAVGSSAITTAQQDLTTRVAESEAEIAGAKAGASEGAKLSAQLKLKPEVESAVKSAVDQVEMKSKIAQEQRSNSRAYDLYTTAVGGLINGLSGTDTGPFVGWLPALTSNQQIANGAIAAMAPVLKGLFRTAGEGTFTDKDQELLLAMVPTRKDTAEARTAKLQNIDAIVRAKLGVSTNQQPTTDQQQPTTNEQTFTTQSGITFTVK